MPPSVSFVSPISHHPYALLHTRTNYRTLCIYSNDCFLKCISSLSSQKTYRNQKMCAANSVGLLHSFARKRRSKRPKVQVYTLARRSETMAARDMELKNLKLFLENQIISEDNKKLRNKVNRLHQENLVLMSELEKKFPRLDPFSATLHVLHKY